MKYFILDIIPKIQKYSKKLDEVTLLTEQHWVSVNDIENTKSVFIFRRNSQLIISEGGRIERGASWEYIGANSIVVDRKDESYLFKHGFLDENILALKLDGSETYALFINETKYGKEINNVDDITRFLETKYLYNKPDGIQGEKLSNDFIESIVITKFGSGTYKLPHPDSLTIDYLSNKSHTLVFMIEEFPRYMKETKNDLLPVYAAFVLNNRNEKFNPRILLSLERYSQTVGFNDFSTLIEPYRI